MESEGVEPKPGVNGPKALKSVNDGPKRSWKDEVSISTLVKSPNDDRPSNPRPMSENDARASGEDLIGAGGVFFSLIAGPNDAHPSDVGSTYEVNKGSLAIVTYGLLRGMRPSGLKVGKAWASDAGVGKALGEGAVMEVAGDPAEDVDAPKMLLKT